MHSCFSRRIRLSFRRRVRAAIDIMAGRRTALDISTEGVADDPRVNFGLGNFGDASIQDVNREFAAVREPIGKFVVFGVAEDMFDQWFQVDDTRTEGADKEFDRKVQEALRELQAKEKFMRGCGMERMHGWAIIAVGFEGNSDLSAEASEIAKIDHLHVYPKTQVTPKEDTNKESERFGLPDTYIINRGKAASSTSTSTSATVAGDITIHHSRVIHLAPYLKWDSDYEGESRLDVCMDDITILRNMRWAFGETMWRTGAGFIDVTIQGLTPRDRKVWIAAGKFRNLNTRTSMIHSEKESLEFKGPAGHALNPQEYYKPIMESLAIATEIPEPILRGAQAGTLTGSEVNVGEYWNTVSKAQKLYEPYLRWLIDRLKASGQIDSDVEDYEFKWLGGYELNVKDAAWAKLTEENARVAQLAYMTPDEVRDESDKELDPLPDGQGEKLITLGRVEEPVLPGGVESTIEVDEADVAMFKNVLKEVSQEAKKKLDLKIDGILEED